MNAVELLQRLHQHRAWVNRNLLTAAANLSDGQLRSPFAIGQGSVWKSLVHLYAGEYVWLEALLGNDDPLESDIAFHVAVLHATDNRFYAQLEDAIETALRISIAFTNRFKGVATADIKAHYKVLEHIEAGHPKKAYAAMEAIIREVMEFIEQARATT